MKIKDKVIIVTGASSGIGLAAAKLFAGNGAKVALVARSKDKLESIAKSLAGSLVVVTDMSKEEEIRMMIKKIYEYFGRIDVLVNNAGQGYDAMIEKIDTDTFRDVIELDLIGPLVAMQEVIPVMRKQGGGAIVNISSGTALMQLPGMAAYSSLKRALVGLSLTAQEELKEDKITVSVVYPYITDTDFEKNTLREKSAIEEASEEGGPPFPADPPELVAEKILEAAVTGKGEVFAHDWMNNSK